MAKQVCCVDQMPIEGQVKMLGGRAFCERHYNHVVNDRKGMWNATIVMIVLMFVFVFGVSLLPASITENLSEGGLLTEGVILALIPAILWLAVFYLQDRAEPEPKGNILSVFLLGGLLAQAVGQPLINSFFKVNAWASDSLGLKIAAGILIVGGVQEFLKYAAVRYTIFRSAEFDERIDGIIYGAAAGLGYATMLNITYVVSHGGVELGVGAIRIAMTALAQASFAGLTGYFLGRAKFENMGPIWLPGGLLLSAVLNGLVTTAIGEISRSGLQATPLRGMILASVIAALTFGVLFTIIRRDQQALLKNAS